MAKKSNKTEHVLKLITKNDEAAQDDDFFVINQDISENGTSAVRNAVKAVQDDLEEEIEFTLKPSMERELRYEAKLKIEIEPEIEFKTKGPFKQIEQTEAEQPADLPLKELVEAPAPKVQETVQPPDLQVKDTVQPPGLPVQEAVQPPAVPVNEPPVLKAFRQQECVGSVMPDQNDDLVNIAEILARDKLALVMERMKVCSCRTCVNDVLALALNSLPTKYVTNDSGKRDSQLDIYKKQYETDILAALTKACVRVKAAPRH